ncbi:MAG: deoxyribose-phosphate aldolase, partial [Clostridia bacterium]|nr:deoxyribose-phosphate aldolase [Clostridia bacterium]
MKNLNKYIDHTNLKPAATRADIEKLCADARKWDFASVCVNPANIALAKELLAGSDVKVCTVIGFPLGQNTTAIKVLETENAYALGCDEFDMVINVGKLKDGCVDYVRDEIAAVVKAANGKTVKVIIET